METQTEYNPNNTKYLKLFRSNANVIDRLPLRYLNCNFNNYEVFNGLEEKINKLKSFKPNDSVSLTGKTGTGKTHLAIAIMKNYLMLPVDSVTSENEKLKLEYIAKYNPDPIQKDLAIKSLKDEIYNYRKPKCLFLPVVEMMLELNEASYESGKLKLLEGYDKYDVICLDDLGAEKLTEASRQNLYAVIDRRYRNNKSLIVTSNFTIEDINNTEPRIASRLAEMGQIFEFNGEDYRVKINQNRVN